MVSHTDSAESPSALHPDHINGFLPPVVPASLSSIHHCFYSYRLLLATLTSSRNVFLQWILTGFLMTIIHILGWTRHKRHFTSFNDVDRMLERFSRTCTILDSVTPAFCKRLSREVLLRLPTILGFITGSSFIFSFYRRSWLLGIIRHLCHRRTNPQAGLLHGVRHGGLLVRGKRHDRNVVEETDDA